jgi:hypothetical protein
VFENIVLRRLSELKRDEATGGWRKLRNEELHNLYSLPKIIRTIKSKKTKWPGHVACRWEMMNTYRILLGKPEGNRQLRKPRHRWEDNVKMDLREIG